MKRLVSLVLVTLVLVVGCAPKPEDAARAAVVAGISVPYQNVRVNVVEKDDSFATVKISAELRFAQESPWIEQETTAKCKRVGQEWRCGEIEAFDFPPVPPEVVAELQSQTKIVFMREYDASSTYGQIFVLDTISGSKWRLAEVVGCKDERFPVLAPSAGKVAFACYRDTPEEHGVYAIDLDGKNPIRLTKSLYFDYSWSPDSKQLTYSDSVFYPHVYMVNSDGSNLRDISKGSSPKFSPDGKEIAFESEGSLCKMNSDGSNARCLPAQHDSSPVWSPDGARIAFIRDFDVWIADADYSNQKQLTWSNSPPNGPSPLVWSPDGKWLVSRSLLMNIGEKKIYEFGTDSELNSIVSSWRH